MFWAQLLFCFIEVLFLFLFIDLSAYNLLLFESGDQNKTPNPLTVQKDVCWLYTVGYLHCSVHWTLLGVWYINYLCILWYNHSQHFIHMSLSFFVCCSKPVSPSDVFFVWLCCRKRIFLWLLVSLASWKNPSHVKMIVMVGYVSGNALSVPCLVLLVYLSVAVFVSASAWGHGFQLGFLCVFFCFFV